MRLQDVAEQHEAAAGGAVMAGAEGERRLDLDAELVRRNFVAVVLAMDDEAAGMHGNQILQRGLDPVLGFDDVEGGRARGLLARGERDQIADRGLIGRFRKMHGDVPAPGRARESRDGGFVLSEAFGQQIRDAPGGSFIADRERGAVGLRRER